MDRRRPQTLALLLGWVVWGGDGAALAEPGVPAGEAAATAPAAEPVTTVRIVLWLDPVADAGFAERAAGQTSDLPLSLQTVPRAAMPPSEAIAVTEAERVARQAGAAGVAWCTRPRPGADRLTLHLVAVEGHRLLVRELGDGRPVPEGDVSSATLETAALVLREALRALAEGSPIGEPVVREPDAEAPPAAPATAPARHAPLAGCCARRSRAGARRRLRGRAAGAGDRLRDRRGVRPGPPAVAAAAPSGPEPGSRDIRRALTRNGPGVSQRSPPART